MLVNVIAHSGCVDTIRVCTRNRLWKKNAVSHQGLEPASVLCLAFQSDAVSTELLMEFHLLMEKSDICPANMMELIHICLMILAHQLASSLDLFSNYLTSQPEPNCLWAGYIQAFFGRRELNRMQEVGSSIYDPTRFWLHTGHTRW